MSIHQKPSRPVLRWHGGKWKLAEWIIEHFPRHRVYVEPFGGAASVLLQKERSYAEVYNDLDGDVVTLFRVLQDREQASRLVGLLEITPFAESEFQLAYQHSDDPVERSRRLVIRSYMGFGSNGHNIKRKTGFRANSNRSGTTPAHDWRNYPARLAAIIERLQGVVIHQRDAKDVMRQHDGDQTLHYVDPPYVRETRSALMHSPDCYAHEMSDDDHRAMAECLGSLTGMVIVSGYPSDLYDTELFKGWHRVTREALADGAKTRTEVLWFNPAAWDAIHASADMFSRWSQNNQATGGDVA